MRSRVGNYTAATAEERIKEFLDNANRQLALMGIQRSRRALGHKAARMRKGALEEPGTGLSVWNWDDVEEYVVNQVRETEAWVGVRVATEDTDDCEIENDCALRPRTQPEQESL